MTHEQMIAQIESLDQEQMAYLWRFAPSGHPYFDNSKPYVKIFEERFKALGGMTPEISRAIGWDG